MSETDNLNEKNLAEINRQIFEIKKKIQLSEGQRKAHYEEWDGEKKRNKEKIKQLKKEIKDLHVQLSNTGQNVENVLRASSKYPKEMGALRNKSSEEIAHLLDCKATDLKKKLDLLRHESKKCQDKMKVLADEYHTLLHRNTSGKVKKHSETNECPEICVLENQIHRVEMNLMEAEHIRKKYRIIRGSLLEDSVAFESSLIKLEEAIKKQEAEIKHLQGVHSEAMKLRDATRGTLVRQELSAVNVAKSREKELQDLRFRVDERRLELERLERRIFPTGRTLVHQDSTGSLERAPSATDESKSKITDYLEEAFNKLKAATGETETEDVLNRFLSQRETLSRLSYLRNITEEEKLELERRKDFMVAEFEAFKFAEVKDNEQNAEESEKIKQAIHEEEERKETLDLKIQKVMGQIFDIKDILYSFCIKLEGASGISVPPESEDLDVVEMLVNQVKCILDRIGYVDEFNMAVQQMQDEKELLLPAKAPLEDSKQPPMLVASETDDEDEVPTRGFLKRQAQIIVDAKSRRKQFPMAARSKKTLTIK